MSDWQAIMKRGTLLSELEFPSVCPRCLTEDDLTTYKIGPKQEGIEVPICTPCRRAVKTKARFVAGGIFLLWAVICWGIPAIPGVGEFLVNLVSRLGFPWGLLPPLMLIGTPLVALYSFFVLESIPWPLRHKEKSGGGEYFTHTLALDDEAYARLFAAANSSRLSNLADWAVTPPNRLI